MKNTTEPQTIIINPPVLDQRMDRASKIGKCMAKLIILKTMLEYDNITVLENYIDDIYDQLDKIKL